MTVTTQVDGVRGTEGGSATGTSDSEPLDLMPGTTRRERRRARRITGKLSEYPHLLAMKPRERYLFRSDYFQIDDGYACVLGFFHDDAAQESFGAFWGINRIPAALGAGVSTVVLEQVHRMGERWIDDCLKSSETIGNMAAREQASTSGRVMTRRKVDKSRDDLEIIAGELQNGASYLHVHNRLLVKAPSLGALEDALARVGRLYVDRFATLAVAAYAGEQLGELSNVFARNSQKRGKGFHYTSTEFAGSHSLVTNGLNDPSGEYVGHMVGDVNNSAVLFDVDRYAHHTVVASNEVHTTLGRVPEADLWGSKISQAALLNNHKVVHLVLDGSDLDQLGPHLDALTARLDMSRGDVNLLEMFGDKADELSIFPAHLEKVVLMAEQVFKTNEGERSVVRGSLREILTQFYVDKMMWHFDAGANRDRLRIVGAKHHTVPRLQDLVTYFDTAYKTLANSTARDDEQLHAYSVLRLAFRGLLDANGDLFNSYTSTAIDGVGSARRVIYDFSALMVRGEGIAMAQLVNTVGFAVGALGEGDVVVIHGVENIDADVKAFISNRLDHLFRRGGRVVYLYNSIEKMIEEQAFNRFDDADYTVLGTMRTATVAQYQDALQQKVAPDLAKAMVGSSGSRPMYLRREYVNVVFEPDLALGVNPLHEERRQQLQRELSVSATSAPQNVTSAQPGRR